jgi:ribosomal protein L16 Arg81 hydroxylase
MSGSENEYDHHTVIAMSLQSILGDLPAQRFLEDFFLRQPFSRAGGARDFLALGTWETIQGILADANVDLMLACQNRLWEGDGRPSFEQVRELHAQGYTLVIRHAERHDRRLAELAAGFRGDFAAPVNVHLYATPASQFGFGWHYDAEDVFILQTQGSKEYSLRKNTVNPWPLEETLPADMQFEREIMPVMKCRLEAGDWLYIPAGYWHMGQASEAAISLAVGIMSTTAIDVLDFVRTKLLDSLLWRQRLAPRGATAATDDDLVENYRQVFAALAADFQRQLDTAATARAFIAQRRRLHGLAPE